MYTFEEHTGEVRLRIEAPDLTGLFVEAGRALSELLGTSSAAGPRRRETFSVHGRDREALLVNWLNELIWYAETERRALTRFHVTRLGPTELAAEVESVPAESVRTPVKAATFHGVAIRETPPGFSAAVVLDV